MLGYRGPLSGGTRRLSAPPPVAITPGAGSPNGQIRKAPTCSARPRSGQAALPAAWAPGEPARSRPRRTASLDQYLAEVPSVISKERGQRTGVPHGTSPFLPDPRHHHRQPGALRALALGSISLQCRFPPQPADRAGKQAPEGFWEGGLDRPHAAELGRSNWSCGLTDACPPLCGSPPWPRALLPQKHEILRATAAHKTRWKQAPALGCCGRVPSSLGSRLVLLGLIGRVTGSGSVASGTAGRQRPEVRPAGWGARWRDPPAGPLGQGHGREGSPGRSHGRLLSKIAITTTRSEERCGV